MGPAIMVVCVRVRVLAKHDLTPTWYVRRSVLRFGFGDGGVEGVRDSPRGK